MNVLRRVNSKTRLTVFSPSVFLMLSIVAANTFGNDVTQEPFGSEPVMLKDVIGRAFIAFGVEHGTSEIDFEKVDVAFFAQTKIQTRIAFTFESDKYVASGASEPSAQACVSHGYIGLRRM